MYPDELFEVISMPKVAVDKVEYAGSGGKRTFSNYPSIGSHCFTTNKKPETEPCFGKIMLIM